MVGILIKPLWVGPTLALQHILTLGPEHAGCWDQAAAALPAGVAAPAACIHQGRGLRGGGGAGGGWGRHSDMEWWWWLVIAAFIGAVAAVIGALFYWYRSSGKVEDEIFLIFVSFFRNHKCGCNFFSYCGEEDRKETADAEK